MGIYELSIKRPFTNLKRLLAGILWSILPILNFFAMGYALRCAKLSMKNNFEMPAWDNKGELFTKGILSFVIEIIYLLPFIILISILFFSIIFSIDLIKAQEDKNYILELVKPIIINNLFAFILIILLFILTIYISPSAIMNFVNKDSFGKGFEFSTIFKKAFTKQYFITSLLMLVYGAVVYSIFMWVPLVGSAIAIFLINVTSYSAYGAIYNKL